MFSLGYQICSAQEFKRYSSILETNLVFWFSFDSAPSTNVAGQRVWTNDLGGNYSLLGTNLGTNLKRLGGDYWTPGYAIIYPLVDVSHNDPITIALTYSLIGAVNATNHILFQLTMGLSNNAAFILTLKAMRKTMSGFPIGDWPYVLVLTQRGPATNAPETTLVSHEINIYNTNYNIAVTRVPGGSGKFYVNDASYDVSTGEVLNSGELAVTSLSIGTSNICLHGSIDNLVVFQKAITAEEWSLLRKPYPWSFVMHRPGFISAGVMGIILDIITGEPWRPFNVLRSSKSQGPYSPVDVDWRFFYKIYNENGIVFIVDASPTNQFFQAVIKGVQN